ncbi:MAG TPA: hypothetical protein VHR43_16665 [Gemmatimonadales bacterium]|nr:hypothetical protein [Gemmatimonadales bacterium]
MPCLSRRSAAFAIALLLASCGDDGGFSPTLENLSGSYSASAFTVTGPTGTTDLLARGALVQATLTPDGTLTGRLLVPGGDPDGGDFEEDLAGTWTLAGSKVSFSPRGPAIIRNLQFTADRDQLAGELPAGGQTIRLVLTRDR